MMKREMFFEDGTKLKIPTEIIEERITIVITILVIGMVFIFLGIKN
jgi:hypothetical protein